MSDVDDELAALEAEVDREMNFSQTGKQAAKPASKKPIKQAIKQSNKHTVDPSMDFEDGWEDPTQSIDFDHINRAINQSNFAEDEDFDDPTINQSINQSDLEAEMKALQSEVDAERGGHEDSEDDSIDFADDEEHVDKQSVENVHSRMFVDQSISPSNDQSINSSINQSTEQTINQLKQRAIKLKQENKIKEALEVMRQVKVIEQSQSTNQSIQQLIGQSNNDNSQASTQSNNQSNNQPAVPQRIVPKRAPPPPPRPSAIQSTKTSTHSDQSTEQLLPSPTTPITPSTSKRVEPANQSEDDSDEQSNDQSTAQSSKQPMKQPHKPPVKQLSTKDRLAYEILIKKLTDQTNDLNNEMIKLLKPDPSNNQPNNQPNQTNKLLALQYHRLKKRSQADLELVQAAFSQSVDQSNNHLIKPPTYQSINQSIQYVHENLDVEEDEVAVEIRSVSLSNQSISQSNNLSLNFKLEVSENTQASQSNNQTISVINQASQSINHTIKFNLPLSQATNRSNKKSISRAVKHSKLIVCLIKSRFLLGSSELGRGEVRLARLIDRLNERSEIEQLVSIRSNNPSVTQSIKYGDVNVKFQLRHPLNGMDIRTSDRLIIQVDEFDQTNHVDEQPASQVSPPKPTIKQSNNQSNNQSANQSAKQSEKPTLTPLPEGITEDDLKDPHNPLEMFSNDVLEKEIEQLNQSIKKAKQSNSPSLAESLNDRLIACSTQLTLLIAAVQQGQVDLDQYLETIKQSIKKSIKLTKVLMERSRADDARLVMERLKIMKNEVQQAEEHRDELEE